MEKLLSAGKLEPEKNQSSGGFYPTVAKTLKENIVKGLYFLFSLGGPFLLEWPTFSGLNSPKLIALRPLPSPHPLFFLSLQLSPKPVKSWLGPVMNWQNDKEMLGWREVGDRKPANKTRIPYLHHAPPRGSH